MFTYRVISSISRASVYPIFISCITDIGFTEHNISPRLAPAFWFPDARVSNYRRLPSSSRVQWLVHLIEINLCSSSNEQDTRWNRVNLNDIQCSHVVVPCEFGSLKLELCPLFIQPVTFPGDKNIISIGSLKPRLAITWARSNRLRGISDPDAF